MPAGRTDDFRAGVSRLECLQAFSRVFDGCPQERDGDDPSATLRFEHIEPRVTPRALNFGDGLAGTGLCHPVSRLWTQRRELQRDICEMTSLHPLDDHCDAGR